MLFFGIDVLMLSLLGVILVLASCIVSSLIPLCHDEGTIMVRTTAITVVVMIVGYIVMSRVLDCMVGAYW